jgi:16S rRNA G966 N2-methylase RsmD
LRLAGQKIGGFYACAPEAVRLIAHLLTHKSGAILDPCAGEGEALSVLGEALGAPAESLYAIELERERAEAVRERLPESTVLGPCSFFDTRVQYGTFGLVWCNPPFDHNVNGGRAEADFLIRSTSLVPAGGIVVLIIPAEQVSSSYYPIVRHLLEQFEQLAILHFPPEHRPFNEVAVIGRKRKNKAPVTDYYQAHHDIHTGPLSLCKLRWEVPELTEGPRFFEKCGLTDGEILEAMATSPLWSLMDSAKAKKQPRPPLPLGKGHLALLLASGQLDGIVHPEGEEPHVVRGVASKVPCDPEVTTEETPSGGVKTTTVIRERIQLVVRAVGPDGNIRTFA